MICLLGVGIKRSRHQYLGQFDVQAKAVPSIYFLVSSSFSLFSLSRSRFSLSNSFILIT